MPIINSQRNINPLDTNKKVTIGVAFPLNDVNLTSGTQTTKEQLKSNFLNLLMTNKGERVSHPDYGFGLLKEVFENSISGDVLLSEINDELKFYMPQVVATEVDVQDDPDFNKTNIKISYTIAGEGDAIQLSISNEVGGGAAAPGGFSSGGGSAGGGSTSGGPSGGGSSGGGGY